MSSVIKGETFFDFFEQVLVEMEGRERKKEEKERETWDEIKQLAVICQHQHPCTEFHAWCVADRKYSMIGREPSTHSPHFFGEF